MANPFFRFKQFTVYHDRCAMKVTTDACLFGAWVAETIDSLQPFTQNLKLLDIGTGTGLLSLMVAQKTTADITTVEIEESAAGQAAENVNASPWQERIEIVHADVLQWQTGEKFACIFSNPPFYEKELRSDKEAKNMAHHDKGLRLTELFSFIRSHLLEEGSFFLLLPAKREAEVTALLSSNDLWLSGIVYVQQTLKHRPFRLMIQGHRKRVGDVKTGTVTIRNDEGAYTPAFVSLLKDYYLYL